MTQPLVVEYLRTHTFQQLEDDHGVVARLSETGDKIALNYDQILARNGDHLAEQCRGLVVRPRVSIAPDALKTRIVGEVEVLAWPMNRFYNLGDGSGAAVWWGDPELKVYEKLDGTMIVIYWDEKFQRWCTGTRGVAEADVPINVGVGQEPMTFSELFRKALEETFWRQVGSYLHADQLLNESFDKNDTYVFELTSPYNRVVVKYDDFGVTLLARRAKATGQEKSIQITNDKGYTTDSTFWIPRPRTWDLSDPIAISAFVNEADPAALEGAVVCDSSFRRLKIKSKAWVLSSRTKDMVSTSRRSAVEAILMGTVDDVIPLVAKEIGDELAAMQDRLRAYLKQVDANFVTWKEEADGSRKRFAELVNLSDDWATPYFQLMDGKGTDALDWAVSSQKAGKMTPRFLDTLLEKIKS